MVSSAIPARLGQATDAYMGYVGKCARDGHHQQLWAGTRTVNDPRGVSGKPICHLLERPFLVETCTIVRRSSGRGTGMSRNWYEQERQEARLEMSRAPMLS